jgi:hypothetical protein
VKSGNLSRSSALTISVLSTWLVPVLEYVSLVMAINSRTKPLRGLGIGKTDFEERTVLKVFCSSYDFCLNSVFSTSIVESLDFCENS